MREREDDGVMITRQEPRPLQRQPALGLEIRTLRTGAVAARVIPDTGDVAVGARLDMTAQGGCPALHEGVRGSAHVGRRPRSRRRPLAATQHNPTTSLAGMSNRVRTDSV